MSRRENKERGRMNDWMRRERSNECLSRNHSQRYKWKPSKCPSSSREMMLSMAVMKANVRRPAELVLMGASGKNSSQVPLPSTPTGRRSDTYSFTEAKSRKYKILI